MIISVASGKGGTGKTTVAVNLCLTADSNVQLMDCDVEEPNAHIFLKPEISAIEDISIKVPKIDKDKCNYCGKCKEVCVYNALAVVKHSDTGEGSILVFSDLCHGCGACSYLCPQGAIDEEDNFVGVLEKGIAGKIEFIHGKLRIGAAMSPPLIRKIKKNINKNKTVIIDAPPGTSCSMVTTVKDSDYCILVTEPTPFGLNDLRLAYDVVKELGVPCGVVINRADLGTDDVEMFCKNQHLPVLAKIPFSKKIAVAYSKGYSIVEVFPEYKQIFKDILNQIKKPCAVHKNS